MPATVSVSRSCPSCLSSCASPWRSPASRARSSRGCPSRSSCLFLGWTVHNDVAYDNTAFWLHVASDVDGSRRPPRPPRAAPGDGTPGRRDRLDRDGGDHGNWAALPGLLGVSLGVLLVGLGISSVISARFPYPVVRPGDSPFAQPQSAGTAGAIVQSVSFFATRSPSRRWRASPWLGRARQPRATTGWHSRSRSCSGSRRSASVCALGGRIIERDGPELLALADAELGFPVWPNQVEASTPWIASSKSCITQEQVEEGDHEKFSHYAPKNAIMESAADRQASAGALRQALGAHPRPGEVPDLSDLQRNLRETREPQSTDYLSDLYIDGAWRRGAEGKTFAVIDPSDGSEIAGLRGRHARRTASQRSTLLKLPRPGWAATRSADAR